MNNILEQAINNLNDAQKEAVLYNNGSQLILAGAGSGKTTVLVTKLAYLINQGIKPNEILALTFTNKASNEMKTRIVDLIGLQAKNLIMGTFHSVFIKFLKAYSNAIYFNSNFTIANEEDSNKTLTRVIDELATSLYGNIENASQQTLKEIKAFKENYKTSKIKKIISLIKNNGITVYSFLNNKEYIEKYNKQNLKYLGTIYSNYEALNHQNNVMDFDDILIYTYLLLSNYPQIRHQIASMFKYILIDEFQDTNKIQMEIIYLLTINNKNICVVGDDSQSIYAFRGAIIDNILNFKYQFNNCKITKLTLNYRSTKKIVDLSNKIIKNNKNRLPKICTANNDNEEPIHYNDYINPLIEAEDITDEIKQLIKTNKCEYKDITILYRTNAQSRLFEQKCIEKNIPYKIINGLDFYSRMEIKDIMAYLKLCINPYDNEALLRIINKPIRGIGTKTLKLLSNLSIELKQPIWNIILNNELLNTLEIKPLALKGISEFINIIKTGINLSKTLNAYELYKEITNLSHINDNYYKNNLDSEDEDRKNNIEELSKSILSFVQEIEKENENLTEKIEPNINHFIENTLLMNIKDNNEDTNKISLMTIHSAKGLEFKTVFIVGMINGLFPLYKSELEEERRLFYVAMTRAKTYLFISSYLKHFKNGKYENCEPSIFIDELIQ